MAQIPAQNDVTPIKDAHIGIVVAQFNQEITQSLLNGALAELEQCQVPMKNIVTYWVPGAFEIPVMAKRLCQTKQFDAIICFGAVIKGETPHFDYVCENACRGIANVSNEFTLPVINGVLTVLNDQQAKDRAGLNPNSSQGHLGRYSAQGALQMIRIFREIHEQY